MRTVLLVLAAAVLAATGFAVGRFFNQVTATVQPLQPATAVAPPQPVVIEVPEPALPAQEPRVSIKSERPKPVIIDSAPVAPKVVEPLRRLPSPLRERDLKVPRGIWLKVDKGANTTYLMRGERVLQEFPCATGRDRNRLDRGDDGKSDFTPEGWHTITRLEPKPDWNPSARIREEYDLPSSGPILPGVPENALGEYWMSLSCGNGIGLHGTNDPTRIGKYVTHGCVSFLNEDILVIAEHVKLGTPVFIKGEGSE